MLSLRAPIATLLVALALLSGCGPLGRTRPLEHLVLVTVDTLRADRIGAYGYEAAATPAIDSLAREAIRFERAYTHASMTLPSVASLLTGQLPLHHGLYGNRGRLSEQEPTLASRLREAGFTTAAFIGNYALRPSRGLDRGFDRYTQDFAAREEVRVQPENLAGQLTEQAIEWLEDRDAAERLFLWVHYQEPHGPYTPPAFEPSAAGAGGPELGLSETNSGLGAIPKYQWLGHGRLGEYQARYDGEISEVDRHFGRLLEALEKRGVLADALLLFVSDHGEAFGEDGLYCAHGEGLGEVLLRVPLLMRLPGRSASVRRDAVRLIDVAPTVLELLGLKAEGLPGHTLTEEIGDRPVVAQIGLHPWKRLRSVRDGGFELVENAFGRAEFRELSPGAGGEASEAPAQVRERLEATLRDLAPWPTRIAPEPLEAEEREALQAMGYID